MAILNPKVLTLFVGKSERFLPVGKKPLRNSGGGREGRGLDKKS
jgi:hypothetical protein